MENDSLTDKRTSEEAWHNARKRKEKTHPYPLEVSCHEAKLEQIIIDKQAEIVKLRAQLSQCYATNERYVDQSNVRMETIAEMVDLNNERLIQELRTELAAYRNAELAHRTGLIND